MADYYIELFQALQELTENKKLDWVNEPDTKLAFSCKTIDGNTKIVLDKYTAINDSDKTPCFNMSAFDDIGRLQTEIVLCDMSKESKEYELIKNLYNKVEELSYIKMMATTQPIVHRITESFQKMVVNQ